MAEQTSSSLPLSRSGSPSPSSLSEGVPIPGAAAGQPEQYAQEDRLFTADELMEGTASDQPPTEQPTQQPDEQPTQQPTEQPTEQPPIEATKDGDNDATMADTGDAPAAQDDADKQQQQEPAADNMDVDQTASAPTQDKGKKRMIVDVENLQDRLPLPAAIKDLNLDDIEDIELPGAGVSREVTDSPGDLRTTLDMLEMPLKSNRMRRVYDALAAVAKEFNIQPTQWQTVTDELRASDKPTTWKREEDLKKATKGGKAPSNKGWLDTDNFHPVVALAPDFRLNFDSDPQDVAFGHLKASGNTTVSSWLKMAFSIGSQVPSIELRVETGTADNRRAARVYIYGTHLTRRPGVLPIELLTSRSDALKKFFHDRMGSEKIKREQPQLHRADLNALVLDNRVTCIDIKLLEGPDDDDVDVDNRRARPIIRSQVTGEELQRWSEDATKGTVDMTDGERFLGLLHAGRLQHLKFYYPYRAKNSGQEFNEQYRFCQYFQSVMLFANRLGNLWAFRQQMPKADWQDAKFPFGKLEPLRWTVRSWFPPKVNLWSDEMDEGETPLPEPAAWSPLDLPQVYPGIEESQFLTRLGLSDERRYQYNYTQRLLNAHAGDVEVAIHKNPFNSRAFQVDIWCNFNKDGLGRVAPLPDTSVAITLQNKVKLVGKIVNTGGADLKGAKASSAPLFGHTSDAPPRKPDFEASVTAPNDYMGVRDERQTASLAFLDDSTVFQRQFIASLNLTSKTLHKDEGKGIYLPQLLFNAELPSGHDTDYYRRTLDPARRSAFDQELRKFSDLSEAQQGFVQEALAPANGLAIAQGPPGTGKSKAIVALVQSATKSGHRVLVCSPTNGALHSLIQTWAAQSDSSVHGGRWCHWSGAYAKSGYRQAPVFEAPAPSKVAEPSPAPNAPAGEGVAGPSKPKKPRRNQFEALSLDERAPSPDKGEKDDEELPPVDSLGDLAQQDAAKADKLSESQAKADRELLEQTMQAYWINQAVSLGAKPDQDKWGFSHRRMQLATAAAARQYEHVSEVASAWLDMINQVTPLSTKKERSKMLELEAILNRWLLRDMMKVVFSTCNMTAHETLASDFRPDIIIIDEVGAALTVEMAIPLVTFKVSVRSVALVGDHEQLAPTFVSGEQNSAATEMRRTVFERYAKNEANSILRQDTKPTLHFFDTQHRSHPDIVDWTSRTVYGGKIQNGPSTTAPCEVSRTIDEFLQGTDEYFKRDPVAAVEGVKASAAAEGKPAVQAVKAVKAIPGRVGHGYRIGVNVNTTPSGPVGTDTSPRNEGEVIFVKELLNRMLSFEPKGDGTRPLVAKDFLVETPYGSQREAIRQALKGHSLHPECKNVEVCSLTGIQGREANIVIFSMVQNREDAPAKVGFVRDGRNLNVASSRAKKLSVTAANFQGFLQCIADRYPAMTVRTMDKFRSFVDDFQAKKDIIPEDAFWKALDNKETVTRERTDWPKEFKMSEQVKAHKDDDTSFPDPAGRGTMHSKPRGGHAGRGGRGGRGGSNRGGGKGKAK